MTFEELHKIVKDSFIEGIHYYSGKYEFRTLTVFTSKAGYKVSVRWAQNIDFAGERKPTLAEAFESMKEEARKNTYLRLTI